MKNFFDGLTSYGNAFQHISKYGLWGYVLLPGLLALLIGLGMVATAWSLSDNVGDWLDNLWRWDWGRDTVAKIAQVFGGLLVLAFGLLISKQLVIVVSSPFMSLLSEKVENQLLGRTNNSTTLSIPQMLSDLSRGLRIALRNLVRELSATVFLLILGLIPIFSPFTTALIFIVQAYYAGFGNIDFALERHYRYRDSIRFVQNNRMLALGNGTVFVLLLLTVVGFFFAVPLSTVAATIETVKRLPAKPVSH